MPRQPRRQSSSDIYHVITRGNSKQTIFEDDLDRKRFLKLLEDQAISNHLEIFAYCLMTNHVHMLLRSPKETLSSSCGAIFSSYAAWFNSRNERIGHLFQDRFKSEAVEDDAYFITVIRYIHNNPLKAGLSDKERWDWSSYHEYMTEPKIVSTSFALGILGGIEAFINFHDADDETRTVLDISDSRRVPNDEAALAISDEVLGNIPLTSLKSLSAQQRDHYLNELKSKGLGVRQIQRLTGISLGVISKA